MNLQAIDNEIVELPTFPGAKRQEWTDAKRLEWKGEHLSKRHDPPALSLGERGIIQDSNKSMEMLFGFRRCDLVWRHVSILFPQLVGIELVQAGQVNPLLKYLCRCGQLYQAQNRQGDTFSSNLSFVRLEYDGSCTLRMIVRPSGKVMV